MQIRALGSQDRTRARRQYRGRRLQEEKGFLRSDIVQLLDVIAFMKEVSATLSLSIIAVEGRLHAYA